MSHVFRYYRPPEMIGQIGNKLASRLFNRSSDEFAHLRNQLKEGEILIVLYKHPGQYLVAAHVGTAERFEEIEKICGLVWDFYAVSIQELNNHISEGRMEGSD